MRQDVSHLCIGQNTQSLVCRRVSQDDLTIDVQQKHSFGNRVHDVLHPLGLLLDLRQQAFPLLLCPPAGGDVADNTKCQVTSHTRHSRCADFNWDPRTITMNVQGLKGATSIALQFALDHAALLPTNLRGLQVGHVHGQQLFTSVAHQLARSTIHIDDLVGIDFIHKDGVIGLLKQHSVASLTFPQRLFRPLLFGDISLNGRVVDNLAGGAPDRENRSGLVVQTAIFAFVDKSTCPSVASRNNVPEFLVKSGVLPVALQYPRILPQRLHHRVPGRHFEVGVGVHNVCIQVSDHNRLGGLLHYCCQAHSFFFCLLAPGFCCF